MKNPVSKNLCPTNIWGILKTWSNHGLKMEETPPFDKTVRKAEFLPSIGL